MRVFFIYTDGSCQRNPGGPGSWAAVIIADDGRREISGFEPNPTTSNRMEIQAAIEALNSLGDVPAKVFLRTDSKYLLHSATAWMRNWEKRGWMRKDKVTKTLVPARNVDLWKEIDRLMSLHRITWEYVPGHGDCAENNRCDALALNAREGSSLH